MDDVKELKEELKRTQTELEHLKQAHQDFIYMVSHDMEAALRTISSFTQIIQEEQKTHFNEDTKVCFDFIMKSVEKSKAILEGLRDFSRLTTRAEPFSTFECNALLKEVQTSLAPLIDSKKAQIKISNLPKITADRQQIALAFFHILQNALTYQEENKPPHISITTKEKEDRWEFCIQDSGIGIPDHMIEEIFKPLKRAVGDQYPGIGMGLPIVRKVLQQHSGDIKIEKIEEGGTSAHFYLAKDVKETTKKT